MKKLVFLFLTSLSVFSLKSQAIFNYTPIVTTTNTGSHFAWGYANSSLNASVINSNPLKSVLYEQANNVAYVGGSFASASFAANPTLSIQPFSVLKIDLSTGLMVSTFSLQTDGLVNAIEKIGNKLFIGGTFSNVIGAGVATISEGFVCVNANTGQVIQTFTPGGGLSGYDYYVEAFHVSNDTLAVASMGGFALYSAPIINSVITPIVSAPQTPIVLKNAITSGTVNFFPTFPGYSHIKKAGRYYIILKDRSGFDQQLDFHLLNMPSLPCEAEPSTCFTNVTVSHLMAYDIQLNKFKNLLTCAPGINSIDVSNDTLFCFRNKELATNTFYRFRRHDSTWQNTPITSTNTPLSFAFKMAVTPKLIPWNVDPTLFNNENTNYQENVYDMVRAEDRYVISHRNYDTVGLYKRDGTAYLGGAFKTNAAASSNGFKFNSSAQTATVNFCSTCPVQGSKLYYKNDRIFFMRYNDGFAANPLVGAPNTYVFPNIMQKGFLYSACITPTISAVVQVTDTPVSITGNTVTLCNGKEYTFQFPPKASVYSYTWSYSGSGATVTTIDKDKIKIYFSYNHVPGILSVYGNTRCGTVSNTLNISISLLPKPNITAPTTVGLNCYNNLTTLSTASTTNIGAILSWQLSNVATNTVINAQIASPHPSLTPLTYTAIVTASNGCTNYTTTTFVTDTVTYPITNVNPSYTIFCAPNIAITASTSCSACTYSLSWQIGSVFYTNPLNAVLGNTVQTLICKNQNLANGCSRSYTTTAYKLNAAVPYTMQTSVTTSSLGTYFTPITCYNDSVLLSASAAPSVKLWWSLNGDSVPNPRYAKVIGAYTLKVKDTLTGCTTSFLGLINQNKIPPLISLQTSSAVINCSFSTATLLATSLTPSTTIQWQAPALSFTAANPATATQAGTYIAIVTNTVNGCKVKDSVNVQLLPTLFVQKSVNDTLCYGSAKTLTANPIGGTPPYSYVWSNNASNSFSALYPNLTANTVVTFTVTDNANCVGKDTIRIRIPSQLLDSSATFKGCLNPTGTLQVFGKGGTPPYRYSINNGSTYQSSSTFGNLAFGTYTYIVKDTLGCVRTNTADLNSTAQSAKVDFLVNSTLMQTDTFVVVDISNPRPDSIKWTFPPNTQVLQPFNMYAPIVVMPDTGFFNVKAVGYFGGCRDSLNKLVHFIKYDTLNTKYGINLGIKTFSLYPNPNTGQFTVFLEFYRRQKFVLKINAINGTEVYQSSGFYGNTATIPVSMPINTNGTYILKVIGEYDAKQKTFVISN